MPSPTSWDGIRNMWGINPVTLAQILGTSILKDALSTKHGAPKIIRDKITLHVANKEIDLARSMANAVAQQDADLFEELKAELRSKLTEKEYRQIFPD